MNTLGVADLELALAVREAEVNEIKHVMSCIDPHCGRCEDETHPAAAILREASNGRS